MVAFLPFVPQFVKLFDQIANPDQSGGSVTNNYFNQVEAPQDSQSSDDRSEGDDVGSPSDAEDRQGADGAMRHGTSDATTTWDPEATVKTLMNPFGG